MIEKKDYIKSFLACFCLAAIAFLAGLPFRFTGAELFGGKPQSNFWSNNIESDKFVRKNGIIYLDRLDRNIEYNLEITFEIRGDLEIDYPAVDRKKIPFKEEKRDITTSGAKKKTEDRISFIIPKSDENGAVIRLALVKASAFSKNINADNIFIRSARIEPVERQYELGHLFRIMIFSSAVGLEEITVICRTADAER